MKARHKISLTFFVLCSAFLLGFKSCPDTLPDDELDVVILDCASNCNNRACIQYVDNEGNVTLRVYVDSENFNSNYSAISYPDIKAIYKRCYNYKMCCERCRSQ